jgi:ribosomal protein L22
MGYTFEPEQPHAKAFGRNMRISAKDAQVLCKVVKRKKLTVVKRLLQGLVDETRSLEGAHYTSAAQAMLELFASCEENAKAKGLDAGKLFVHAAATNGTNMRRSRRKAAFGSHMKSTNVEVMLLERGARTEERKETKKAEEKKTEAKK